MATQKLVHEDENNSKIVEELTSSGEFSGLEIEKPDPTIHSPFDPNLIDVVTQPYTVDLLLSRLEKEDRALDLQPDFQRRSGLWNNVRQSQLIESLLLKIPLPSLYVSEDKEGVFSVVDGLQRLSSIARFVDYKLLTDINPDIKPLILEGLESLREFEGFSFDKLPKALQRRIKETQLTVHVIRPETPDDVRFNIFARINQGGLPLTAQEIRNATIRGNARKVLKKFAESKQFLQATDYKIKTERMGDFELVLRFIALCEQNDSEERPDNLDEFLNMAMRKINSWSEDHEKAMFTQFKKAMINAEFVFGKHRFRKYYGENHARAPINRGLFEAQSVVLAKMSNQNLEKLAERKSIVMSKLKESMKYDTPLYKALLYATGKSEATKTRVKEITRICKEVLDD
jgi:hypothetical protein